MSNTLYVLYACDENYAPYTGISMNSLFENNRDLEHICVYLVQDHVSEENQNRWKKQAEDFGRELILVDASAIVEQIQKLGIPSYRGSYTTNFRMFFHTFIPEHVDRLLYIDSDTVITDSLAPLLTIDLQGAAVGVVRDSLTTTYKEIIGMKAEDPYFNAGITFINVPEWKRQGITDKLLNHIKNVRARYCNPDQDLLNIVLKGSIYVLPPEYNFQPAHRAFSDKAYFGAYRHVSYYSSEELDHARRNPKILHTYRFLGDFPWHAGNLHPDNAIFDEYMKRSPWRDYQKKPAGRGMIFTVEKWMYRLLPKGLFLKIFAAFTLRNFKKQNAAFEKEEAEAK